jgi:hypothetical protein
MEPLAVECTHCRVVMTTWVVAGSRVRYWQCPFCRRTHSSLYGEAFRGGAGARLLPHATPRAPAASVAPPQATPEEIRWASLKVRAARWFARLEAEGRPARPPPAVTRVSYQPAVAAAGRVRR